jgi:hypothetical protein
MIKSGLDECLQDQCTFNKNNPNFKGDEKKRLIMMCPTCQCGATSNIINKDCIRCIKCENVPNYTRSKDPLEKEETEQVIRVGVPENINPEEPLPVFTIKKVSR